MDYMGTEVVFDSTLSGACPTYLIRIDALASFRRLTVRRRGKRMTLTRFAAHMYRRKHGLR